MPCWLCETSHTGISVRLTNLLTWLLPARYFLETYPVMTTCFRMLECEYENQLSSEKVHLMAVLLEFLRGAVYALERNKRSEIHASSPDVDLQ
jgi:hypothetical protein